MTATNAEAPVRLDVQAAGEAVRIMVVGEAEAGFAGRYRLEVTTGANNRSTQSGTVRLMPGQRAILATVTVSVGQGQWEADLFVEPGDGIAYKLSQSGRRL
jgi:hypothetical protein